MAEATAKTTHKQETPDTSSDTLLKQYKTLSQKEAAGTLTEAEKKLLEEVEKKLTEAMSGTSTSKPSKKEAEKADSSKEEKDSKEKTEKSEDEGKNSKNKDNEPNAEKQEKETKKSEPPQTTLDTSKALTEALAKKDAEIGKLKEQHTADLEKAKKQQATLETRLKEQETQLKEQENKMNDTYINTSNEETSSSKTEKAKSTSEKIKKEKKQSNFSRNPVNRVVGTAASVVGGVGTFIHRRNAKVAEIRAEPSQLFTTSFRKNLGHNIKKTPKQIGKTLTAGFRKHEKPSEMVNPQQSHTKPWSREATKGQPMWKRIPKVARWLARKPAKFVHRLEQTTENVMGDMFGILKDTKISGNPKKWNFWKPSTRNVKEKFMRTRRSWHMLTHRDGKATEKTKFKIIP
jgi:hypothetical protein